MTTENDLHNSDSTLQQEALNMSASTSPPMEKQDIDVIKLPSNLGSSMLRTFDELASKDEILWTEHTNELTREGKISATFQLAPYLTKKPIQDASDPSRKTGKGGSKNPFVNPEPSFVVTRVGPEHTLLLNKYPVYRPSAILHTNEFQQQSDDLNEKDLAAAFSLLKELDAESETENNGISEEEETLRQKQRWLLIYNCGVNSGSSQGHKHMQLWPYQEEKDIGFRLFPDGLVSSSSTSTSTSTTNGTQPSPSDPSNGEEKNEVLTDESLPYAQFTIPLHPHKTTISQLIASYAKLLALVHKAHQSHAENNPSDPPVHPAYNVALTTRFLTLIPRRYSGAEFQAGSNTAGMLGLIWISDESEKEIWMRSAKGSLKGYLEWLGVPRA